MATGSKCKYLRCQCSQCKQLDNYASAIAAAALANRWRHAANFLCILCLSKEGDHLSMRLTAQQTHKHNRCREHSSSLQTARRARRNGMSWLPWLQ